MLSEPSEKLSSVFWTKKQNPNMLEPEIILLNLCQNVVLVSSIHPEAPWRGEMFWGKEVLEKVIYIHSLVGDSVHINIVKALKIAAVKNSP